MPIKHESDCLQRDRLESIANTLTRMERGQEQLIDVLQRVANQAARLENLEDTSERLEKEQNVLFSRMRDIELNVASSQPFKEHWGNAINEMTAKLDNLNVRVEEMLRFYDIITSKKTAYVIGVFMGISILGLISDVVNHTEWMKSVWHFFK